MANVCGTLCRGFLFSVLKIVNIIFMVNQSSSCPSILVVDICNRTCPAY